MPRKNLVNKISEDFSELEIQDLDKVINLFFRSIAKQLKSGGRVELRNFGVFKIKIMPDRTIYNPYEKINDYVRSAKVPNFRCSEKIHRIIK